MANVDMLTKASFGQYGSTYITGDGAIVDLNGATASKYVIAITMLEQTTFAADVGLQNLNGEISSISSITAENDLDNVDTGIGAAGNGVDITTTHKFPTGVTIYGKWDYVELNSGSCICYFAPRGI